MSGIGKQSKKKKISRSVDMYEAEIEPSWDQPPKDECKENRPDYLVPPGAPAGRERVFVRTWTHRESGRLVQFAVGHQTRHGGEWRDVCVADSCHPDEVHAHRFGKSAGSRRVGRPEHLMAVASLDDVDRGYQKARERVLDRWKANRERWLYG